MLSGFLALNATERESRVQLGLFQCAGLILRSALLAG